MRQGLGVVLDAYDDLVLVGEAENGEQAVQLAQDLEPNVIVMDIQMPVKDGLAAIREIAGLRLETRILVLTSYPDDDIGFPGHQSRGDGVLSQRNPLRATGRGHSAGAARRGCLTPSHCP